jgi:GST-like protein
MTKQTAPIDFYYSASPNGRKITIMLEELGVPFTVHYLHFSRKDQFKPEFLKLNPNNKVPVITDPAGPGGEPITVFESGAVLKYLAEKFGRFYPTDWRQRVEAEVWLTWSVASFAPFIGQLHHFYHDAPEQLAYPIQRYENEMHRLYKILSGRLEGREWMAADMYSIVDISTFGWVHRHARHKLDLATYPIVKRWYDTIIERPAVVKALAMPTPPRIDNDPVADAAAQIMRFNQE